MALIEEGQSDKIYLSVMNGKFARNFSIKPKDIETEERKNSAGNTVFTKYYKGVKGQIVKIEVTTSEYGEHLVISLDGGEEVQMYFNSGYARAFLNTLPNIEKGVAVSLTPSDEANEQGKAQQTIFVSQNDKPVKWAFTKDNPNGLPALVETGDAEHPYDSSAQLEFYKDLIAKW